MSKYIADICETVAGVLDRATRAQPEQFAGYWANVEFWISEYEHVVDVAAGYEDRFQSMKAARDQYIQLHGGPHNLDDSGHPYYSFRPSKRSDRLDSIGAVQRALERFVERAQQLGIIGFEDSDRVMERIVSARRQANL
jgi:hypothetical protein